MEEGEEDQDRVQQLQPAEQQPTDEPVMRHRDPEAFHGHRCHRCQRDHIL